MKDGEVEAALNIITSFAPKARKEPGLELLTIQQSAGNPQKFMFYEIFSDEAAFATHQETAHFKQIILEEALPRLSHRERVLFGWFGRVRTGPACFRLPAFVPRAQWLHGRGSTPNARLSRMYACDPTLSGRAAILKSFGRRRRTKVLEERTRGVQVSVYGDLVSWLMQGAAE